MAKEVTAYILRQPRGTNFVYVPKQGDLGPASVYPSDGPPRIVFDLDGDAEHAIRNNWWVSGGRTGPTIVKRLSLPSVVQQAISGTPPKAGHGRQIDLRVQSWLERILR